MTAYVVVCVMCKLSVLIGKKKEPINFFETKKREMMRVVLRRSQLSDDKKVKKSVRDVLRVGYYGSASGSDG